MKKTKAEAIQQHFPEVPTNNAQLAIVNLQNPEHLVSVAKQIAKYVNTNALSVKIEKDKAPYVMVEGWQFTGALLGCVALIQDVINESSYKEVTFEWTKTYSGKTYNNKHQTKLYKYRAKAVFINQKTGITVGQGFAMCSNEEEKKHKFDEYAIESMAQTRAIGKAARMAFGFVIKAAGYEPTPAEEMEGVKDAEEKKTEVQTPLDKKIIDKIEKFEIKDELSEWAGSDENSAHHSNPHFRNIVNAKYKQLKKKELEEIEIANRVKNANKKTNENESNTKSAAAGTDKGSDSKSNPKATAKA